MYLKKSGAEHRQYPLSAKRKVISDLTQKFRCNPQVGGDLYTWYPVGQGRVLVEKGQVSLLCCGADILQYAVLHFNKFVFKDHLEIADELGKMLVKIEEIIFFDKQDVAWLDRLDKKFAGLVGIETADVGNPVILGYKLEVMLFARLIDCIYFETTVQHKAVLSTNLTILQEEIFSFQPECLDPADQLLFFPGV